MTDDELIAMQARRIEKLKAELADYKEAMGQIRLRLYCIGGPLNDNVGGYSKAQLGTFFDIAKHVIEADCDAD
jgi:hypothetical protein